MAIAGRLGGWPGIWRSAWLPGCLGVVGWLSGWFASARGGRLGAWGGCVAVWLAGWLWLAGSGFCLWLALWLCCGLWLWLGFQLLLGRLRKLSGWLACCLPVLLVV